jgi:hypothetical protein
LRQRCGKGQFMDPIKKHYQSLNYRQKKFIKLAQNHRLPPGTLLHNVMFGILNHTLEVIEKKHPVSYVNRPSDLFKFDVSHLFNLKDNIFILILYFPLVSNYNLLVLFDYLPLTIHFKKFTLQCNGGR